MLADPQYLEQIKGPMDARLSAAGGSKRPVSLGKLKAGRSSGQVRSLPLPLTLTLTRTRTLTLTCHQHESDLLGRGTRRRLFSCSGR